MNEDFYHQYLAQYRPFKPYWNYEDGCVLLGCLRMFRATGESGFAYFILRYLSVDDVEQVHQSWFSVSAFQDMDDTQVLYADGLGQDVDIRAAQLEQCQLVGVF